MLPPISYRLSSAREEFLPRKVGNSILDSEILELHLDLYFISTRCIDQSLFIADQRGIIIG